MSLLKQGMNLLRKGGSLRLAVQGCIDACCVKKWKCTTETECEESTAGTYDTEADCIAAAPVDCGQKWACTAFDVCEISAAGIYTSEADCLAAASFDCRLKYKCISTTECELSQDGTYDPALGGAYVLCVQNAYYECAPKGWSCTASDKCYETGGGKYTSEAACLSNAPAECPDSGVWHCTAPDMCVQSTVLIPVPPGSGSAYYGQYPSEAECLDTAPILCPDQRPNDPSWQCIGKTNSLTYDGTCTFGVHPTFVGGVPTFQQCNQVFRCAFIYVCVTDTVCAPVFSTPETGYATESECLSNAPTNCPVWACVSEAECGPRATGLSGSQGYASKADCEASGLTYCQTVDCCKRDSNDGPEYAVQITRGECLKPQPYPVYKPLGHVLAAGEVCPGKWECTHGTGCERTYVGTGYDSEFECLVSADTDCDGKPEPTVECCYCSVLTLRCNVAALTASACENGPYPGIPPSEQMFVSGKPVFDPRCECNLLYSRPQNVAQGGIRSVARLNRGGGYDPGNPPEVQVLGRGSGAKVRAVVALDGGVEELILESRGSRYCVPCAGFPYPGGCETNVELLIDPPPGWGGDAGSRATGDAVSTRCDSAPGCPPDIISSTATPPRVSPLAP